MPPQYERFASSEGPPGKRGGWSTSLWSLLIDLSLPHRKQVVGFAEAFGVCMNHATPPRHETQQCPGCLTVRREPAESAAINGQCSEAATSKYFDDTAALQ